jgi:ADP-heptose:LPS heptosyltransferase
MHPPDSILLIKAHSMGIGDLLRSSASWRALKNRWPQVDLHLLMLSKHSGYASEGFIRSHHLLSSTTFVTVKTGTPGGLQHNLAISEIEDAIERQLGSVAIDMVIDCEPYGIKTSLLTRWIARRHYAISLGIAQFPLRRFFYDRSSVSVSKYIKKNNLTEPMDYTERDFVVLDALKISRESLRIELQLSAEGLLWQRLYASSFDKFKIQIVLNIGCGTLDALSKRPPMPALADAMVMLYRHSPFVLHLTGAEFEKEINLEFIQLYLEKLRTIQTEPEVHDWAGQCTLNELTGLLASGDVVISSDSGPFHMAVALNIPTLCWFNFATPASYHQYENVANLVTPTAENFTKSVKTLMTLS